MFFRAGRSTPTKALLGVVPEEGAWTLPARLPTPSPAPIAQRLRILPFFCPVVDASTLAAPAVQGGWPARLLGRVVNAASVHFSAQVAPVRVDREREQLPDPWTKAAAHRFTSAHTPAARGRHWASFGP